ncbi:GD22502 [Drosophila simulans]|uniref:GD22502 n=1 Tax=Drosophila simulans TaxID=7240 RepID=B4Q5D9_DROSI|nr:GD22502 [Drosophila simulans]
MMMLPLLWVLLVGASVFGSPLEMQLLDMMLREAEDYPSNGRDQRDISVLPAAPIGCDDSENQLKRLRALRNRRKNSRAKSPKVPDPPQIKLDNASQPSEVIQVIMTTEPAEMKLQPEVNTTTTTVVPPTSVSTSTSNPEITTSESCDEEVKSTTVSEFSGCDDDEGKDFKVSENGDTPTTEEPCEDTEEQDTNLCPQFMPTQGPSASPRPPPSYRFRKPVKNYVEPILYERDFAKPIQQMTPVGPQQRDYFVSNKQIVPRPRPKYRKRIPPSIYMNNIVRGLDCSDERQYMMERDPEPRPQYHHYPEDEVFHEDVPLASPTPSLDPCQQEHDHVLFRQRPQHQQTDHLANYPLPPISSHFFT